MKGIYIHIPFCEQKCRYCDFLSFPGRHDVMKHRYLEALSKEIRRRVSGEWQEPDSIFIGGGTPTALSEAELKQLMKEIESKIDVNRVKEYTVEANPGTINMDKLNILLEGGVNRISFGVQSFDDMLLRRIGRLHSAEEAIEAVAMAKTVGFENINIDLIYGLPGQSFEQWKMSLQQGLALNTTHLSLYQLIVEPHTAIARAIEQQLVPEIDEDGAAEWFDWQRSWLIEQGYHQYEISNYAKQGYESIHNQLYWKLESYLGLGLGATGWERPLRKSNSSEMNCYLQAQHRGEDVQSVEILSTEEQMEETVFMSLRMNQGLSYARFERLYGKSLNEVFSEALKEASERNWIIKDSAGIRLSDEGRRMGNWVFELFIK